MPKYEQIIESFINGQYSQAYTQLMDLGDWEQADFTCNLRNDETLSQDKKLELSNYLLNRLLDERR